MPEEPQDSKMQTMVTVTGEVANPKSITVPTEKISILEAISPSRRPQPFMAA